MAGTSHDFDFEGEPHGSKRPADNDVAPGSRVFLGRACPLRKEKKKSGNLLLALISGTWL